MANIDLRSNTENTDCVFGVYIHDSSCDVRLLGYCKTEQSAKDLVDKLIAQYPGRLDGQIIRYSKVWDLDSQRYQIGYDQEIDMFYTYRS